MERDEESEEQVMQGDGVSRSSGASFLTPTQLGFPAELTSAWDSQKGYSWKRLQKVKVSVENPTMQEKGDGAVTPDNDESLESGTVGWMEPDPGRRGYFFLTISGSDGGSSGGSTGGCDWVDALRTEHCLRFSFVSGEGACACAQTFTPFLLTSGDGLTWTSSTTIPVCGVNYTVSFSKEACNGPCLTITSVDGAPCCDEVFEADVAITVTFGEGDAATECTGTLSRGMGDAFWTGALTCPPPPPPPPAGTCLDPIIAAVGASSGYTGTRVFKFTPGSNGTYSFTITTGVARVDERVSETCGNADLVEEDTGISGTCCGSAALTMGTDYYIQVEPFLGGGGIWTLTIGSGSC